LLSTLQALLLIAEAALTSLSFGIAYGQLRTRVDFFFPLLIAGTLGNVVGIATSNTHMCVIATTFLVIFGLNKGVKLGLALNNVRLVIKEESRKDQT
jgi:hypothetical protein